MMHDLSSCVPSPVSATLMPVTAYGRAEQLQRRVSVAEAATEELR